MMEQARYIQAINKSWDEGFLAKLKDGIFDKQLFSELYNQLLGVQLNDNEQIERELIQVLWFIPIFMYRFKRPFEIISDHDYDVLRENIEEQLARIFGYP